MIEKHKLAKIYFPDRKLSRKQAVRKLTCYIRKDRDLMSMLTQLNYQHRSHMFTDEQKTAIFHFLGDPQKN